MLGRDKIAIMLSLAPVLFLIVGAFMLSDTDDGVTAAAVSNLKKVTIGSISEKELITEDILLKHGDVGTGSTTTISSSGTSTISGSQSSITTSTQTTVIGVSGSSILTTSTSTTTIAQPRNYFLIPTEAKDNYGIDQIMPDQGNTDGTVELSNDDTRWLTVNGEYIEVTRWNQTINIGPRLLGAIMYCEVDYINSKSGYVEFSYDSGNGWSQYYCSQFASQPGTYSCDLGLYGVDTLEKVNNLKTRCRMRNNEKGGIGFAVDSMMLEVVTV